MSAHGDLSRGMFFTCHLAGQFAGGRVPVKATHAGDPVPCSVHCIGAECPPPFVSLFMALPVSGPRGRRRWRTITTSPRSGSARSPSDAHAKRYSMAGRRYCWTCLTACPCSLRPYLFLVCDVLTPPPCRRARSRTIWLRRRERPRGSLIGFFREKPPDAFELTR